MKDACTTHPTLLTNKKIKTKNVPLLKYSDNFFLIITSLWILKINSYKKTDSLINTTDNLTI